MTRFLIPVVAPARNRPHVFQYIRLAFQNSYRQALRLTNSQTLEITTDPSPTDDATRFTEPARTSPTAKMPGSELAKGEDPDPSPEPVITKPLSSSSTKPESHS